ARYGEAEQYFRQSLALAQRFKSPRNTARAQVNFGSLLVQQGRAGEGAIQVSQALDFYRQGNYRQEAALAQALVGRAASLRGQYDEARRIFEGLLQDATKQNNPSRQALAQQDLGVMLAAQERYPEALTFLEQRERISRAQGNQRGVAYAMPEQGHVLWRLGRDGEARSRFDQASAIASAQSGGKITEVLIDTELGRAELALAYRQFAVARSFAARALTEEEATTRRVTVKIKTAVVDCLAQAFAGTARTGLGRCEQAVRTAEESGSLGLLPGARLALARARLAAGDAAGALSAALEAQSDFGQRGQLASEHLAWLVAAHAAELSGDTARSVEYNARAADVQSRLQQLWGTDNLNSYLTRPDVQAYRTILRAK
ncbi:MAG: tetratricopeptide repeat protein, partial [Pyrinomonadaceae bacterium]